MCVWKRSFRVATDGYESKNQIRFIFLFITFDQLRARFRRVVTLRDLKIHRLRIHLPSPGCVLSSLSSPNLLLHLYTQTLSLTHTHTHTHTLSHTHTHAPGGVIHYNRGRGKGERARDGAVECVSDTIDTPL